MAVCCKFWLITCDVAWFTIAIAILTYIQVCSELDDKYPRSQISATELQLPAAEGRSSATKLQSLATEGKLPATEDQLSAAEGQLSSTDRWIWAIEPPISAIKPGHFAFFATYSFLTS